VLSDAILPFGHSRMYQQPVSKNQSNIHVILQALAILSSDPNKEVELHDK
jgi:hypothetical protein